MCVSMTGGEKLPQKISKGERNGFNGVVILLLGVYGNIEIDLFFDGAHTSLTVLVKPRKCKLYLISVK
jgi:hypothetical protein